MSKATPPSPEPAKVENLCVQDGKLTWTQDTLEVQLGLECIVFVLKSANGYTICCLRDDPDKPDRPYELVLLKSDTVSGQLLQEHLLTRLPSYLCQDDRNQVDIIVSTKAGTGRALEFWQAVLQPLWKHIREDVGVSPLWGRTTTATSTREGVLITQNADSVPQFARSLWMADKKLPHEAATSRTIVLLSGDGAVVDLLNGCVDFPTNTPLPLLALIPLGTGNALFHSLHRPLYSSTGPLPLVLALRTLFLGTPATLPIFQASFSAGSHTITPGVDADISMQKAHTAISHLYGAIVASYGFHASIVYESDTPAYRVHGRARFGMVAQNLLREAHPYTAHVEVRRLMSAVWEPVPRREHLYVLTTLVSNLERMFEISPESRPLDGKLRVLHFGDVGGQRTMEIMKRAYDGGKHVGMEWDDGQRVSYEEVDEVKIVTSEEDGRWRKVCIDGTIVEIPKGGQMTVKKLESSPLRVLTSAKEMQSQAYNPQL